MTNFDQKASKISEKISKIDQKMRSKIDQKKVILNGKSEKTVKFDQKTVKKHHFLRNSRKKRGIFSHKEMTPQSACHGSGRWGQKGVKRGPYL